MWRIFLFFCLLVLSIIGLSEVIHRIWMIILKPKTLAKKYLVVLLQDESAYQQLVYAQEHLRWAGQECANGVIAVDCGLSEKCSQNCSSVCNKENESYIFGLYELSDIIKKENILNGVNS